MQEGHERAFDAESLPVYIWTFGNSPSDYFYGFPSTGSTSAGIKVATEQHESTTTAESVDRAVTESEAREMYDHCISGRMPRLKATPLRSVTCPYTVTPDFKLVIDRDPDRPRVMLASPCSGHGFKHSAAIGEALAQTALDGKSTIHLAPFNLRRFGSDLSL